MSSLARQHARASDDSTGLTASATTQALPTESEYPPSRQAIPVMAAIVLAVFLIALDRTIIATAIPAITNDFHSLDDIGWYGSAFMLTFSCFQMLLGRIYTFYPPKYVFLGAIVLFEIGSAVCGAAPNSISFTMGRTIAGIGAAGTQSGAVVLMLSVIPLAKRPAYQGLFAAVFGVASVSGPLLGGAFTTEFSWRWCFYINLPIGAVTFAVVAYLLPSVESRRKGLSLREQIAQLDPIGTLLLVPSIICLLLALEWGGSTYAWSNGRIITLLVMFAVLFLAFAAVQVFKPDTATIPGRIIRKRSIVSGMWFTFTLASTMTVLIYYVPIWFQAVKGVSAVRSGIDTVPLLLSLVVGAVGAGELTSRIGFYTPFAYASATLLPIGAGLISTWTTSTGHEMWIGYQIILGFGLGLGMQQANLAAQTVLPRADVPTGISLMFFTQIIGGAIFVSVGQNIFTKHLVSGISSLPLGLNASTIINTGATELRQLVSTEQLPAVVSMYNDALRNVFYLATGMAAVTAIGAFGLEWKTVKGQEPPRGTLEGDAKESAKTAEEEV